MRKLATAVLVVFALVGVAGRAEAKPSRYRFAGAVAEWYSSEQLSPTTYRETFTFVEAFADRFGNSAFFGEDVWVCTVGVEFDDCQPESFRGGESEDGFVIDDSRLGSASLDTVVDVQAYDDNFDPIGQPVPVAVDVSWTGTGKAEKYTTKLIEKSTCTKSKESRKDTYRDALAAGTLTEDGVETDLGDADFAFLAKTSGQATFKTCGGGLPFARAR